MQNIDINEDTKRDMNYRAKLAAMKAFQMNGQWGTLVRSEPESGGYLVPFEMLPDNEQENLNKINEQKRAEQESVERSKRILDNLFNRKLIE